MRYRQQSQATAVAAKESSSGSGSDEGGSLAGKVSAMVLSIILSFRSRGSSSSISRSSGSRRSFSSNLLSTKSSARFNDAAPCSMSQDYASTQIKSRTGTFSAPKSGHQWVNDTFNPVVNMMSFCFFPAGGLVT